MQDAPGRTSIAAVLAAVALAWGCSLASVDPERGSFNTYFIPRPQHMVWDALLETLEERAIPIARKDRQSFRVVTGDLMARREKIGIAPDVRFADCPAPRTPDGADTDEAGSGPVEPASSVLTVTLRLRPAGTSIALRLRSVAPAEAASGEERLCDSTMTVEQKIVAGIQDRVVGEERR